jgi:predicted Co/Zn/Cd cation transporter (cation efflux family)
VFVKYKYSSSLPLLLFLIFCLFAYCNAVRKIKEGGREEKKRLEYK